MADDVKIRQLFSLGEVGQDDEWFDYLAYGFSEADVGRLIALLGDASLLEADPDSPALWVTLHAWRALGQLRSEATVEPLLALLDTPLIDDSWAFYELPVVLAMVGERGLGALQHYLLDSGHRERSRMLVMDALMRLWEFEPDLRDRLVEVLRAYLHGPDLHAAELNGLLLCCLCDLNAVEALDAVRELFESASVDISYAGSLDEVEVALTSPSASIAPVLQADGSGGAGRSIYDEIEQTLSHYARPTAVRNCSELDGFFTSLGCAPSMIAMADWLPAVWGGEAYQPHWSDELERNTFSANLQVAYNRVLRSLNDDTFAALYLEREEAGERVVVADDWCRGFLRGVNMWPAQPRADALFLERSLRPMRLFSTQAGGQTLAAMSAAEVAAEQRQVEDNVRALYQRSLAPREPGRSPVVASPRPGRNDPCICGSGRKFKRCCLH